MSQLKKELGLLQGIGLLSTSLLGSGVFAVPAIVAYMAGSDSLWAWLILLFIIFPITVSFAELGKRYPNAGGVAYFISKAFNPMLGKATGWSFLTVIPFGLPASLQIASGFWHSLFDLSPNAELAIQIATLCFIWLLGLFGAGASGWVQSIIAILIIGLVIAICLASSPSVVTIKWPALSLINMDNVLSSLAIMFWCFVGLEAVVHLTSEFKHPEKDFPRALIFGLVIACFVYWVCTAAVLMLNPPDATVTTALPKIFEQLFGHSALWFICIIGYLACFASINIYCQSFARLIWAQTAISHPQSHFAQLSTKQTPVNALSIVMLFTLLSLIFFHFITLSLSQLLEYANGVFVLIYLLAMISGVKLLQGKARTFSLIGVVICLSLLLVIGYKSFYAIGMFILLWFIAAKFPSVHIKSHV